MIRLELAVIEQNWRDKMATINLNKFEINNDELCLDISVTELEYDSDVFSPKISVFFVSGDYIRPIPMVVNKYDQSANSVRIDAAMNYKLDYIFGVGKKVYSFQFYFYLLYGAYEKYGPLISGSCGFPKKVKNMTIGYIGVNEKNGCDVENRMRKVCALSLELIKDVPSEYADNSHAKNNNISSKIGINHGSRINAGISGKDKNTVSKNEHRGQESFLSKVNRHLFKLMYKHYCKEPFENKKITFLSNRRDKLDGNMKYVYDKLSQMKIVPDILLKNSDMKHFNPKFLMSCAKAAATSGVIVVDDSVNFLDFVDLNSKTRLIQLWHACGAFKTFGYSRLGKLEGPSQTDRNHRFYTHAIVSSTEIAKFYSEGFGIPMKNVYPTGIPRTDIFFNEHYKNRIRTSFFTFYPKLEGKKIILFAPTFRGMDKESAYYDMSKFDPVTLLNTLGDDYVLLIKHHPYISEAVNIPEGYKDRIIDLTCLSEINDLLFVTDILITDYSSVIFEASLLNIPMLFYVYDLKEYILDRDFYYDFIDFIPGNMAFTQNELINQILTQDYDTDKEEAFRNRFFDQFDGNSSQRVADMIAGCVR